MTRDEWNEMAAALAESWKGSSDPLRRDANWGVERPAMETVESSVRRVADTQAAAQARVAENERPVSSAGNGNPQPRDSGSTAMEVLKVAGMVTGVGPVITGLVKLFGGGSNDKTDVPTPVRYELPQAVHLDAGLMAGRSVAPVSYAQNNLVRADVASQSAETARTTATALPAIQIQVNAMDSRSFMDHSDEIAQAVRTAMLRSHAINDVISEV